MKVGVIGTGYWGRNHVFEFKELGIEVIAADSLGSNFDEFSKYDNVKATKDYKDIIKNKDISTVTICVPNRLHFPIAKECLLAGKNVLVEKPISETEEQAQELIETAKKKGLILMTGHIYRFNNAVDKAKEMMESGELGNVIEAKIQWINDEYSFQPDFDKRVGDRDVITDLGVHAFDILHYIFGKSPDYIACAGGSYRIKDKVENMAAVGKLGNAIIKVEISWITPPKTRALTIIGDKKSLFVDCAGQKVQCFERGKTRDIEVEGNNTIGTELKYFLGLCSGDEKENKASGNVGKENLRMLKLTKESIENKKAVQI